MLSNTTEERRAVKASIIFEAPETKHPSSQHYIPELLNLQQHRLEEVKPQRTWVGSSFA
jgi:hypothetical protein